MILTYMVIDFVFRDKTQIIHKEEDLGIGIYRTLQGQYLEYRFLKKVDNILVYFCLDLLADYIQRVSQGKLKVQLEMLKIEEIIRDIDKELKLTKEQVLEQVTISIVYKPKAKKI